jgi:hypothetical protein
MKNIAKCKICKSVIESHFSSDYVVCKCGEIGVYNGLGMDCEAKNWDNFLRIDDLGNEKSVKYIENVNKNQSEKEEEYPKEPFTYEDGIDMLNQLIKNIEELPDHVKLSSVNHYDLISFMLVISSIFKNISTQSDS